MQTIYLFLVVLLPLTNLACDRFKGNDKGKQDSTLNADQPAVDPGVLAPTGPRYLYFDNGKIKAERNYKDNLLSGTYKEYYDNGQVKLDGYYLNDMMNGSFKYYTQDGILKSEETYKDNLLIERKTFAQNGN